MVVDSTSVILLHEQQSIPRGGRAGDVAADAGAMGGTEESLLVMSGLPLVVTVVAGTCSNAQLLQYNSYNTRDAAQKESFQRHDSFLSSTILERQLQFNSGRTRVGNEMAG